MTREQILGYFSHPDRALGAGDGVVENMEITTWRTACPCHEDPRRRLHIMITERIPDSKVFNVKIACFARGCKVKDICAAVGLPDPEDIWNDAIHPERTNAKGAEVSSERRDNHG